MFSLTIVFGTNAPVLWTLLYQTEERAKSAYEECVVATQPSYQAGASGAVDFSPRAALRHTCFVALKDDFSQVACIDAANIHGFMIEDMDRSQLGQIEKGIHDRRGQMKMEQMCASDPSLRQSSRQPSMPILQPMGNGFRPVS